MLKKGTIKKVARVSANNPMVGTWEQERSSRKRTTVVYTISIKQGKFVVSANDDAWGVRFKISRVKWDGSSLSFTSFYPRSQHTANVVFRVRSKRKLNCNVSGTYFDGELFSSMQVWTRKRGS